MAEKWRTALIVAHGQPSDPHPAEAEIAALAHQVSRNLPDWHVMSATLACPGALAAALAAAKGAGGLVYPMFMTDGWFTRDHLPGRLRAAGAGDMQMLPPFGLDPAVQALTVSLARQALAGTAPDDAELLLAAHGSSRSPAPAAVAQAMAERIARQLGLARVVPGFIDQQPRIADVARSLGPRAVCLPFFAARGGHVTDDVPRALAEAGFAGRLLDPVGSDPSVPGLIAARLRAVEGESGG